MLEFNFYYYILLSKSASLDPCAFPSVNMALEIYFCILHIHTHMHLYLYKDLFIFQSTCTKIMEQYNYLHILTSKT